MKESESVAESMRTFFAKNASGDISTYEEVASLNEAVMVVGSTAQEWFDGQAAVRQAYGLEGVLIDPGQVKAWENGDTGWALCRPLFTIPGGPSFRLRFTAVFVQERGSWKLIHLHASYPVPDETALSHPEWWDVA